MTLNLTPETLRDLSPEQAAALPPLLRALWSEAHGDWAAAHAIAQEIDTPEAAWVHAYLHRCEGDTGNAAYWYRRAGRPAATGALAGEWRNIAMAICGSAPLRN